jgi:diguanylate cyclase (GGDEF)-like protein
MNREGLEQTIAELADVVSRMDDVDQACELVCDRLQEILSGPVAILERAGPRWRLRCGSANAAVGDSFDDDLAQAGLNFDQVRQRAAAVAWAWIPLGAGDERVMLIPAGWRRADSAAALELIMRQLGYALAEAALRARTRRLGRLSRATYGFSRRLAESFPAGKLYQFITDKAVEAGRGQQGALALYAEADGELGIVATCGYPRLLVDHVRVRPGEGIIGLVFETQRPMLVADISKLPHLHRRRPRYRTTSFMATPILARGGAMGVICVTDRVDGAPFEPADLEMLRALAGPAALALRGDDLARQAELLGQWAAVDPLTELFNRRYFRQRLQEEFQRARRYNLPLSLLLLDLDDFKRVNDTYGHSTGDAVLRAMADVLRRNVRTFDLCCRYGGEEFVLVLPGSDAADALSTADRVRLAVAAQRLPSRAGDAPIRVTVSVGAVTLGSTETVDDLIEAADRALYQAKQGGKNQTRAAESSG